MTDDLSPIDIKILEQVQKDSSLSTGELAEKVGLSQSPCWRRLQRLKDEGYIDREVALLNREKFANSIFLFATLKMAPLTDQKRTEFIQKVNNREEILECYTIFGDRDILVKIVAPSMAWYQDFIFKVVLKLPGVEDIQSTVTISELKYKTSIPVRGNVIV